MPTFRVTAPDGRTFDVTGPEGSTADQARAQVQAQMQLLQSGQRDQRVAATRAQMAREFDPTADMSTTERMLAGIGSGMTSVLRAVGGGRIAGALGLPATREDAERIDAPLAGTTAGTVGQVIGAAAPAALAIPFTPATFAGAAAAGGLTGAAMTEGGVGDRALGAGMGGLGALAGHALPYVARVGYGALKGLAEPFVAGGRDRIAGRTLRRFATDENALRGLSGAQTATGARQTLAEATRDRGLATLERAIGQMDPQAEAAIAARAQANNAARVGVLQNLAGGPGQRAAAEGSRKAATSQLYADADSAVVPLDDAWRSFMQRPAFNAAVTQAEKLAQNEGLSDLFFRGNQGEAVAITGQGAHYIKKAMDDAMERGSSSYIGDAAARATGKTQTAFLGWLDQTVPEYAAAKEVFADLSKPLNQMDVGQRLLDKTTASVRDMGGNPRMQANAFSRALNDEESLIRQATGSNRAPAALADLLTPEQLAKLGAVRGELETVANLSQAANGSGSQTAKALASQNLARQIAGPLGLPDSWAGRLASSTAAETVLRPAQFAMMKAEPRIQEAIARGLLDPEEGMRLIELARAADAAQAPNALQRLLGRSAPAAFGGLAAYANGAGQ